MRRRILLIDFLNLYIRNFHAVSTTNENGEHVGGLYGTLNSLKSAIDRIRPSEVYIISDGPHSGMKRKLKNKNYKGNRNKDWKRGAVRSFDFLNEQEQKDSFSVQRNRLVEYMRILPLKYFEVPYVEADDIIAEIANTITDDQEAVIYSTDSDYLQLIRDNVFCYNPQSKKLLTKDSFFGKFDFLVDNYIYFKIIAGDSSDNITGIKGIKEKTFIKMFPSSRTEPISSIDEVIDLANHALDSKAKTYTKGVIEKYNSVVSNELLLRENWEQMQLLDVDVSFQTKEQVRKLVAEKPNEYKRIKLRRMFMEDKLEHNIRGFDFWSKVFTNLSFRR